SGLAYLLQNNYRSVMAHHITGANAVEISESVEAGVRAGAMLPGQQLPTVRDLAGKLRVSPTTVAAAYRNLRLRGLTVAAGRRGSATTHPPPIGIHPAQVVPAHARDLASGNPDPELLPALVPALRGIDGAHVFYGEEFTDANLLRLAVRGF